MPGIGSNFGRLAGQEVVCGPSPGLADELWRPGTLQNGRAKVVEKLVPFCDSVQGPLRGVFDKWFHRCYT
jgi:hypothetical protein